MQMMLLLGLVCSAGMHGVLWVLPDNHLHQWKSRFRHPKTVCSCKQDKAPEMPVRQLPARPMCWPGSAYPACALASPHVLFLNGDAKSSVDQAVTLCGTEGSRRRDLCGGRAWSRRSGRAEDTATATAVCRSPSNGLRPRVYGAALSAASCDAAGGSAGGAWNLLVPGSGMRQGAAAPNPATSTGGAAVAAWPPTLLAWLGHQSKRALPRLLVGS